MQVTGPVTPVEFDRWMAALGRFESGPHVAAGVSGGADSLALALLLSDWIAVRGGLLLALTVDHGLRPESGEEAVRVAAWMADRGIAHRTLFWQGPKPATGIQAGARHARLRLLADAAAADGILHLALAHHADDQAETHRLRAERSSGAEGLAGMPAIREMERGRLIRPLLAVGKARLIATCRAAGQDWIEDPSNRNPAYARARLRLTDAVNPADRQAALSAAQARAVADDAAADIMAAHVRFQAEGWALIDHALLERPIAVAARLIATLLRAVGGAAYPPAPAAVADLTAALQARPDQGRTLGGCQFMPVSGGWRLVREARNLQPPVPVTGGGAPVTWDGRFRVAVEQVGAFTVAALDEDLWHRAISDRPDLARVTLPAVVRHGLPVLLCDNRLMAIPHLDYRASGTDDLGVRVVPMVSVPAVPARFAVVTAADDII